MLDLFGEDDNNMERQAGVLLHITSLPSKYGVGTLGKESYKFVDFLSKSNIKIWQVLPLVATNYGDSPYQSVSSTSLNYYLIDFDILKDKGLLNIDDYKDIKWFYDEHRTDYSILFNEKVKVLKIAFNNFMKNNLNYKELLNNDEFNDFALFMTIKELHNYVSWDNWDSKYLHYSILLENEVINNFNDNYYFWKWTQFEFMSEWNSLHEYAKKHNIDIMGDMPLYVAYDSVEVWKHPELFELDENLKPINVAGCPPDYFCEDGQLWGNPVYNWEYHKETNYSWWNKRIESLFNLFDIVRIDHFRGFADYYTIPYGNENARIGEWKQGPRMDFFKDKLDLNIVAEDLGFIDEPVRELVKETNYPGMKVLEFAFDNNPYNEHKASNVSENFIMYTGTHDNMPIYQFILDLNNEQLKYYKKDVKEECKKLNIDIDLRCNKKELVNKIVELAFASKANTCIIPMQDLLCKDGYSRMNFPSTVSTDNWSYRLDKNDINNELAKRLKKLVKKYNR